MRELLKVSKADLIFSFHKGPILLSTLKLSPKHQKYKRSSFYRFTNSKILSFYWSNFKALHMYMSVIKVSFGNQCRRIDKQFINQFIRKHYNILRKAPISESFVCNFNKNRLKFSCKFWEIFQNTFTLEHP